MVAPLTGVRVVEVAGWMAAPSAAAVLADLGADVVKVEPPRGDVTRGLMRPPRIPDGMPKIDYSFQVDNRGKSSIVVALNEPEGAAVVRRLAADADVFVCNLLHHRQRRYGLDPVTLLAENPRLVHATLSGYGPVGEEAQRPGYDVTTFFGRGAVTHSITEPGGIPPQPRPAQGDHAAGMSLVAGVLAALRLVEQTGEGQVVDVTLLGMAAWTMATDLSAPLIDGRQPTIRDHLHQVTVLTNRFRCADERWIVLNMPEEHWWPRFCAAVEHGEWLDDPRFATVKGRWEHMAELTELIDAAFATRSLAEWGEVFDEHGLIWGPIATLAELAADEQANAAGVFPEIHHPDGSFRTVAAPLSIQDADIGPRGPAPELGEHTAEILSAAGYTAEEIEALATKGVISIPD
jgi:crotonobetainyl-CoA:carnitine CoA-transferase CaiB-like acyl-CoA transferase